MMNNAEVIIVKNQEQSWRADWLLNCAHSNNIKNAKKRLLSNGWAQEMNPGVYKKALQWFGRYVLSRFKSFAYFGAKGANFFFK